MGSVRRHYTEAAQNMDGNVVTYHLIRYSNKNHTMKPKTNLPAAPAEQAALRERKILMLRNGL